MDYIFLSRYVTWVAAPSQVGVVQAEDAPPTAAERVDVVVK